MARLCGGVLLINATMTGQQLGQEEFEPGSGINCSGELGEDVVGGSDTSIKMHLYMIAPIATLLYAAIFVVGVVGNILVCYSVAAYKDMRDNIFHIFLANLSIADLLVVVVCVPTAMVDVFSQEIWYFGEYMCKAVPFLEYSVTHLSCLTILAISFERFLAILFPLKAQYISSRNRSMVIILVIWGVAFVSSIPLVGIAQYEYVNHTAVTASEVPTCINPMDLPWKRTYLFMMVTVFFTVPFFILLVLYALISHHLIKDSYKSLGVATDISAANMRARKSVVVMLATVVGAFFLCLLPFRILTIWTMYASMEQYDQMGFAGWYSLLYFARIMLYLNSACNPLVLYAMSSKFRAKFQHILCCRALPSSSVSRSGTLRYSVRTEYSNSFRRVPDFPSTMQHHMHHASKSPFNRDRRTHFANGNGNLIATSVTPAEEYPML